MALITCKKCGYHVAETAHTCPHCGAELHSGDSETSLSPKKSRLHPESSTEMRSQSRSVRFAIASFLLVLLLVLGYVFLLQDNEQETVPEPEVPAVQTVSTHPVAEDRVA